MNELDEIFRTKLEDFKVKPSNMAWQSIESKLASSKSTNNFLLKIAASLIFILMSSLIGFYAFKSNPQENIISSDTKLSNQPTIPVVDEPNHTEIVSHTSSSVIDKNICISMLLLDA